MHLAVDAYRGRIRSILAVSLILTMVFIVPMRATSAATAPATGIMIPLYVYPGIAWSSVAAIQQANPGVPIIAIINPNSGPGASADPNYVSAIKSLQAAGVKVIGYVPTGYAARSLSSVESMVMAYKNWYPVTGIFFDEMANTAGNEGYYSALSTYAKTLGFAYTVGNPGADTIASYVGTMDTIVIYENLGLPALSSLSGWHSSYPKGNFAMMAYGVPSVDPTYPPSTSQYVGYIYVTDENLPNPYNGLPAYLSAVAAALAIPASATTTTTSTPTATTTSTATSTATATTTTTATATSTTTTTRTVTAVTTTTSTSTVTDTATATTSATSTATATTTATQTATATTTTTATRTANVTTTNTATSMITSTGTETTTTTLTQTATATTTSTATATTTVAATPTANPAIAAVPTSPLVSNSPPSMNSVPVQSPPPTGIMGAMSGALSSLGNFLSAEAQLWGGMLAHAFSVIAQDLRLALSLP